MDGDDRQISINSLGGIERGILVSKCDIPTRVVVKNLKRPKVSAQNVIERR